MVTHMAQRKREAGEAGGSRTKAGAFVSEAARYCCSDFCPVFLFPHFMNFKLS